MIMDIKDNSYRIGGGGSIPGENDQKDRCPPLHIFSRFAEIGYRTIEV